MYFSLHRGTAGRNLPHEDFVRLAARAGFAAADPDFTYADTHGLAAMRDLYAENNLKFGGWGVPFDFRAGAGLDAQGMARLRRFAGYAREVGIDSCGNHVMPSSDFPFMENWNFLVPRIKAVAAVLGEHGLRFGIEPVAPYHLRVRGRHAFLFTPGQILELAAACGENVGLLVDSYHFHAAAEPMATLAQMPRERVVHAHINDAPAGPLEKLQDFDRLLPGEGVIDLAGFMGALKAIGYDGPVSL